MPDRFTPEKRSLIMKSIKGKGTRIETDLAKSLWKEGIRYRKNNPKVFGKPDLTLKNRIAVFVDGEFWHGKDWETQKDRIKSNRDFWIAKIERNIQRDREVNAKLESEGWTVVRIWGREIQKDIGGCVDRIREAIKSKS